MNTIEVTNSSNLKFNTQAKAGALCLGLLLSVSSSFIYAKDYQVEVLLFENVNASVATESHNYQPPESMRSGSETWLLEPSLLNDEAASLSESQEYELKHHYSWGVESLPYKDSANYKLADQETRGFIKVYAEQLLFTNIDLDYKGFRLQEKRRLKLNERHFFDHPKFGILMQVSRLKAKPEAELLEETSDAAEELETSR